MILVVDDEPHLRNSLSSILNLHGYASSTAEGGKTALQALEEHEFELILLDLGMPDIDGHKVMEQIAADQHDTCVIVVSGDISIDSAISALRLGACDYLKKPYDTDELMLKIGNALARRRLEKENRLINSQLKESERWYRYMVNNSPDFIYTLDEKGYVTFCNDRVESLLGYSKDAVIGKHFSKLIHSEDVEASQHVITERRTDERTISNTEIRIPHGSDPAVLTLEFSSFGIYDEKKPGQPPVYKGTYGVARDITERKKASELIMYQAYHDLLTGLANRNLFRDHLELAIAQARRYKHMLALMFLDLDRFKRVNDTLGHAVGDLLLIEVASRLKGCLREGDTLARQGGDEFTLLLSHIENQEHVISAADKIIKEFTAPFYINGHELYVPMSIGIALYPDNGETIDTLIKNADIAMYDSKAKGRNRYQIYSANMNAMFDQRFSLEIQMRKALERNEFQIVYQPQINIATRMISGIETLIRWTSPLLGNLLPMKFIPLAEETGLIIPISDFVLKSAFKQAQIWHKSGLLPQRIAINISFRHLEQEGFVAYIEELLKLYGLSASMFEMEINETTLLNEGDHIVEKLHTLTKMGIKIALDDFGTGYSSMNYLKKFPISTIKIDQSFMPKFIGDSDNESIVAAICSLAKNLRINLIAEGVELDDQYRLLHTLNCNEAQGYLFCKPLPGQEITELLVKNMPLVPQH
ncbi:MAG TPA: EAL domain-containing protein [Burkholderiales bacterium]|nr:EAL domain-containing protein [Burkholderiales bacterium]